jgi:hypothetical protein
LGNPANLWIADHPGVIEWQLAWNAECGHFCHRAKPGCDQGHTEECRETRSEEQLLTEVRQSYNSKVVVGHDLEVF